MWKRIGILGFSLLVGLLILVGGGQMNAHAVTTDDTTGLNAPATIQLGMGHGQFADPSDITNLLSGNNYQLTYNWGVNDDVAIHDGDTVAVTLPNGSNTTQQNHVDVFSSTDSKNKVGDFYIDDSHDPKAYIQFNDRLAKTNVGRTGSLQFVVKGSGSEGDGSSDGKMVVNKVGWSDTSSEKVLPTTITWDIVFNLQYADMGRVTLVDTLGDNQTFDKITRYVKTTYPGGKDDSVYEYSPEIDKDTTLSHSVNGKKITFSFTNINSKKIEIYYQTKVTPGLAGSGGYFTNNVQLTSDNGSTGEDGKPGPGTAETPIDTNADTYWGGTALINGYYRQNIILTKTGADGQPLAGAEYTLTNKNDTDETYTATTNDAGQITWSYMAPGDYYYQETKAPDGYLVSPTKHDVVVQASTDFSPIEETTEDQQTSVILTKTDKTGKKLLANAVYNLEDADGNVLQDNLKTDDKGELKVSGLNAGTYYFEETTAPDGYKINSQKVQAIVPENGSDTVNVTQQDESNTSDGGSTPIVTPSSSSSHSSSESSNLSTSSKSSSSSSSNTSSTSTSSTKAKRTTVANVASSNSSSNTPRSGGTAAGTTANTASKTVKHHTNGNSYLPRTNGQRSLLAILVGFLILGLSLAASQWRRTHAK
ncbi:MSCRAMM family protein [Levilactobacillus fuyuanensis]|uniref:Collagen binding domain-containing protein n=1 Tax=Levilactobacillus fuyuanensis TaxID=2486022 RepID=A0ABW4H5U0_9LACO|nr:SpaA isopeptide-forming pilin-related protein [Levilactobacillus fuyuanensis]